MSGLLPERIFRISLLRKLFFRILYIKKPIWDTGISPPELIEFINAHKPGKALDLGCGTGTNVITLAKSGWHATGVDFVRKPIQLAREKAKREGVPTNFVVNDVTRLKDLSDKFDLILDIGCFHSLSNEGKADYIRNLDRLLTTTGSILMYTWVAEPDKDSQGFTYRDLHDFSREFTLKKKEYGTDHESRKSAWLTFIRK